MLWKRESQREKKVIAKLESLTHRLENKIEETSQDTKLDKERETMSNKRKNKTHETGITEAYSERTMTMDNLETAGTDRPSCQTTAKGELRVEEGEWSSDTD